MEKRTGMDRDPEGRNGRDHRTWGRGASDRPGVTGPVGSDRALHARGSAGGGKPNRSAFGASASELPTAYRWGVVIWSALGLVMLFILLATHGAG